MVVVKINSDGDSVVTSWKVKTGLLQRELEDLKENTETLEQELAKTNEDVSVNSVVVCVPIFLATTDLGRLITDLPIRMIFASPFTSGV